MLSRFEELKLIAKCIAGDDRNAFSRLVIEYEGGLRRFILNLTGNDAALTDDLSQETFLKAYMSLKAFKGIASFKTWLYRIAYNQFIDYRRKYGNPYVSDSEPPDIPDCDRNAGSEAKIDLEACMKSLSDTERSIVLLFYLEDMPIKKVCSITGLPEGTIKSHLSRARAKMQAVMNS